MSENRKSYPSANGSKGSSSWYAMTVFSDFIVFAGQSGKFLILNPDNGQKFDVLTDLDLPSITATESGFAAIGRWNTSLIRWNYETKKDVVVSKQLFTGRCNTLCFHNSTIYVSGVDRDSSENYDKDNVHLSAGKLFAIDSGGKVKNVDIEAEEQITHLAVGDNWMGWIDDHYKNRFVLKAKKKGLNFFDFDGTITSVFADENSIYLVDSQGIYVVNAVTLAKKKIHLFENIDLQVLKLIRFDEHFYGLTSEGVFKFPEEKRVNKKTGQPADIDIYRNKLIVLWQNGNLEFIKKDGTVSQDAIHQIRIH